MGCDIHGWIEVVRHAVYEDDERFKWSSAVDLSKVLSRDYVTFGRLAHDGRRQQDGDRALFAGRGLPKREHLDDPTLDDYEDLEADAHHESHFTHAELTQDRITIHVPEGETRRVTPVEYIREGIEEYNPENPDAEHTREDKNNSMTYGHKKRAWEAAFGTSHALAQRCGHEQVRWVIWFDN